MGVVASEAKLCNGLGLPLTVGGFAHDVNNGSIETIVVHLVDTFFELIDLVCCDSDWRISRRLSHGHDQSLATSDIMVSLSRNTDPFITLLKIEFEKGPRLQHPLSAVQYA